MKRTIKNLAVFVLLVICIAWMNCGDDDNPLAPSSLAGTWNLVTFTNKEDNITATAGQPVDIGNGITLTISGTAVLTETRYDITLTQTTSIPGLPPQTDEENFTGAYSISGSTLTTTEDGTGEIDTATISRSGNQLTIEDVETKTVWEKQ